MALIIPRNVEKHLRSISKADALRILDALEKVAANLLVRQPFVTELVGEPGVWRLRQGDWRATYEIADHDVIVGSIQHRREAYR